MSERRKTEHDEEFAREMADVKPLADDPRGRVERRPAPYRPRIVDTPSSSAVPSSSPVPDDYAADGVDRREIRKLRRGGHTVRARLDLHGMTSAEAGLRVAQFIENSRHAQHRCVCVIHGKGLNSAGGIATLRTRVREVLMRMAAVLAFAPAPPSDGGSGAVYILLRR
jgi:DNA-nicking Smr family endonuclease